MRHVVSWGMFTPTFALRLTTAERRELDAMTRATRIPAGLARRARLILALADGTPYHAPPHPRRPGPFPAGADQPMRDAELLTANNSALTLTVAANYGGRWDVYTVSTDP